MASSVKLNFPVQLDLVVQPPQDLGNGALLLKPRKRNLKPFDIGPTNA